MSAQDDRIKTLEAEIACLWRVINLDRDVMRQLASSIAENAKLKARITELENRLAAKECI
jgi:uncharacterized coiled-coil protein SlyX